MRYGLDLFIRVTLLLPYTVFQKFIEPILLMMYQLVMQPIYTRFLARLPFIPYLTMAYCWIASVIIALIIWMINVPSLWLNIRGVRPHNSIADKLGDDLNYLKLIMKKKLIK